MRWQQRNAWQRRPRHGPMSRALQGSPNFIHTVWPFVLLQPGSRGVPSAVSLQTAKRPVFLLYCAAAMVRLVPGGMLCASAAFVALTEYAPAQWFLDSADAAFSTLSRSCLFCRVSVCSQTSA